MSGVVEIVIVDGATLNPGDLSWSGFRTHGEVKVYESTQPSELLDRVHSADVVITNKVQFSGETIAALPLLRYIGVTATGYDIIDVNAARSRNIVVTNVPTYGTRSVAQMTMALLLELAHRVGHHDAAVRAGRWSESSSFCFWDYPQLELEGRTFGTVGLGRIGKAVALLAAAFGMHVIAYSSGRKAPANLQVSFVDLDTLFRESDVVSLHCPLTPDTNKLVDRRRLQMMKPSALLLNTSRGPLVDADALSAALKEGWIAGAALDVLPTEPPPRDHILLKAPNCILTPHIAWTTHASRGRLLDASVANLRAYLLGSPTNVVS